MRTSAASWRDGAAHRRKEELGIDAWDFQDAVRRGFEKYVTISGRATRSEYWWWFLFVFLDAVFGFGDGSPRLLQTLFSLGTLLPTRRLHDRDMSAWWLLIGLVPLIGLLVLLYFYLMPGPNRFGPDSPARRRPNVTGRRELPAPRFLGPPSTRLPFGFPSATAAPTRAGATGS
jgi:uncharacterized membrane protein YhaH (DUF805 family)